MKIKKYVKFWVVGILLLTAYSCFDDPVEEDPVNYTPEREAAIVSEYIDTLGKLGYDVDTTELGVFYVILEEGEGEFVQPGDSVGIIYTGYFPENGKVFDASSSTWKFRYQSVNLIQGFDNAISYLNKGAKGLFLVPSGKAYGALGAYPSIPPYSALVFEIELVDFYE